MVALRIAAVLLVAAGVLLLLFGGSSDSASARDTIDASVWAGVATILVGNVLLLMTRPKR